MRSNSSARRAGARFESGIAYYLRRIIGDDRIERRAKSGQKDRAVQVVCQHVDNQVEAVMDTIRTKK